MAWSEKARKLGNFNSIRSSHKRRNNNIREYNKNPKKCRSCEKYIEYDKRQNNFCSHRCSALTNNIFKRKSPILYCKICGDKLNYSQRVSCSKECRNTLWLKKTEELLNNNKINNDKILRKYLIIKHGKSCLICKRKSWMGKEIPIEVDHINGKHNDNNKNNLRLICLNCHGQTPTWKIQKKYQ